MYVDLPRVRKISDIVAGAGPAKSAMESPITIWTITTETNEPDCMISSNGYGSKNNKAHDASSKGLRPILSESAPVSGMAMMIKKSAVVFDHKDAARDKP